MHSLFSTRAGRDRLSWLALLLMAMAVVPSTGMVWLMRAATQNERLAARQRLTEAYHAQLESAGRRVIEGWREDLARLDSTVQGLSPPEAFAAGVKLGVADSIVILDAEGSVAYPNGVDVDEAIETATSPKWKQAERLEFAQKNYAAANRVYEEIVGTSDDPELVEKAQIGRFRCLKKLGDSEGLQEFMRIQKKRKDPENPGHVLPLGLELIEFEGSKPGPQQSALVSLLLDRVNDYSPPTIRADQRRFIIQMLQKVAPDSSVPPTAAAERLAAEFLHDNDERSPKVGRSLVAMRTGGVWAESLPSRRAIALFTPARVAAIIEKHLEKETFPDGVQVSPRSVTDSAIDSDASSIALAPELPGWRLSLTTTGTLSLDAAADQRIAMLAWTAAIVVAATVALTWAAGSALRRQMQVARLKNDLTATVSHELKTPLASIRLLVDTLLDADPERNGGRGITSSQQVREYLELISQENARLTRLVENFLTFSRMERGRQRFDLQAIDAREAIEPALAAFGDRFGADDATLVVDVDGPLPVHADCDALTTVIVNLLDNAWKYTGAKKRIRLSARNFDGRIELSVTDNGIGLTPRAARRVFDRYYQADQRLSRAHGGCGLGLAIVRSIVEGHRGTVSVQSKPGEGSAFSISLPAISSGEGAEPLPPKEATMP